MKLNLKNRNLIVRVELRTGDSSWDKAVGECNQNWQFEKLGAVPKEYIKRLYFWDKVTKCGFEKDPGQPIQSKRRKHKKAAPIPQRERPQAAAAPIIRRRGNTVEMLPITERIADVDFVQAVRGR